MKMKEIKQFTFPAADYETWKKSAASSLKGKSMESLRTNTYEGIEIQPIYEKGGIDPGNPGVFPYTRGVTAAPYDTKPWGICQTHREKHPQKLLEKIEESISRGQNVIAFDFTLLEEGGKEEMERFFQPLLEKNLPFYLDLKGAQEQFSVLLDSRAAGFTGAAAEDPISEWAKEGSLPEEQAGFFSEWSKRVKKLHKAIPLAKTILIKTDVYHDAGAHAVQELAMGLALAVEYLDKGHEQGLAAELLAEKIIFSFSLDSNFFGGIAKLRAARKLWSMVGKAYGADGAGFRMDIHARTSAFTQTLFDPHVNILRTANQAFAAVLGGVQYLEVLPYDAVQKSSSGLSERIARNIHLLLREEAHLKKVSDPAGGSWYIEEQTDALVSEAWKLFLEIESQGGALAVLESGWIQGQIQKVYEARGKNVMTRKERIVGTNVYADLSQKSAELKADPVNRTDKGKVLDRVVPRRLSEKIERIRIRAESIPGGSRAGLICLGTLKNFKPRADFVSAFLAAGGIEGAWSPPVTSVQEACEFIRSSGFKHYILCGSDFSYKEEGMQLMKTIRRDFPEINLYLAGRMEGELVEQALSTGLSGFISVYSDFEILDGILSDLEALHNG
ncbi:methylmalonyl-CoA mutase family protein [Peribacillus kribbensis]|uniref:methylmalonyl-CoA mutase family protein n=1 Tax=Peribacillus kribbensis TaxID=356658 RepID=UPI0004172D57|nr:methylmalonyl-CoA mutase family protein [Peribacillus kribbensis]